MDKYGEFLHDNADEVHMSSNNPECLHLFIDVINSRQKVLKLAITQLFFGLFLAHRHGIPEPTTESIILKKQ